MSNDQYTLRPPPRYAASAVIAICLSIGGIISSFRGHAIIGFILALATLPFAFWGFIRSVSPTIRGGFLSITAIALSILGIIVSVVAFVLTILA